jgi:hypothetical protein
MITVYTLVATTHVLLAGQLAAVRSSVVDLARIVIVQGLYGRFCRQESLAGWAAIEDLDLLIVPPDVDNDWWPIAPARVIDWLLQTVILKQPEQYAVILHADTFPVVAFDAAETIAGNKSGGAYNAPHLPRYSCRRSGDGQPSWHYEMNSNWLAIDTRQMTGRESILSVPSLSPVVTFPRLASDCPLLNPLPHDLRDAYCAYGPSFVHLNGSSVLRDEQNRARYLPLALAYGLPT